MHGGEQLLDEVRVDQREPHVRVVEPQTVAQERDREVAAGARRVNARVQVPSDVRRGVAAPAKPEIDDRLAARRHLRHDESDICE
jgi:hypothetical protein